MNLYVVIMSLAFLEVAPRLLTELIAEVFTLHGYWIPRKTLKRNLKR